MDFPGVFDALFFRKGRGGEMKKILAGFIMDGRSGGIDKYLLNFFNNVNSGGVHVDFLTNEIDEELERQLASQGSRIFAIPNLKHPLAQYRRVRHILENEKYDIVYLNISTAIDCIAAFAAKSKGISKIMLHSHSSGNDCESTGKRTLFNIIHFICRLFFYRAGTEYYGCSKKAGIWMFPKRIVCSDRFQTIFNAVDLQKFSYSPLVREEVRTELHLENKFVVGHAGNFVYQKNHYFLIDIFEKIKEACPEAVLLLAGTGERFEVVKKIIKEKGLEDSVQLLGFRKDMDRLMQGMDFFILPSYFEGLPTVAVEAQASGLPCLMSDSITGEAKITESCWFLPLKESPKKWSRFVLEHKEADRRHPCWVGNKENYSLDTLKKQQNRLLDA